MAATNRKMLTPGLEGAEQTAAAEASAAQAVAAKQENKALGEMKAAQAAAPENAEDKYAHMFAEWDLLPPQVLIRRVVRKK